MGVGDVELVEMAPPEMPAALYARQSTPTRRASPRSGVGGRGIRPHSLHDA